MKIAIYAHYSPTTTIVDHAWKYIDSLVNLGFEVHFVSNSLIDDIELNKLKTRKIYVIQRENTGLDFGMWKYALQRLDLKNVSELLLTNSSIRGPLRPLAPIFEKARGLSCDFWGITDSTELAPHLQSYFMVFTNSVINSSAFRIFWESVLLYHCKDQIIRSYEVGLTVWLEENGFTWCPLIAQRDVWNAHSSSRGLIRKVFDRIAGRRTIFENVTLLYPELIIKMGCPFIKNSLLESGGLRVTSRKAAEIFRAAEGSAESDPKRQ